MKEKRRCRKQWVRLLGEESARAFGVKAWSMALYTCDREVGHVTECAVFRAPKFLPEAKPIGLDQQWGDVS